MMRAVIAIACMGCGGAQLVPRDPGDWQHASVNWQIKAIAARPDGGVVAVGNWAGFADFGAGARPSLHDEQDGFVASYDPSGKLAWMHQISTNTHSDDAFGLAVGVDGHVVIAGQVGYGPVDFGDGPTDATESRSFIASYDASGALQWKRVFVQPGISEFAASPDARHLAMTTSARDAAGTWTSSVIALTATGEPTWTHPIAPGRVIESLAIDDRGAITLLDARNDDPMLEHLTPAGELAWTKPKLINAYLAADASGQIFLYGGASMWIDLGGGRFNAGVVSAIVAAYGEDGRYRWTRVFPQRESGITGLALAGNGTVFVVGRFSHLSDEQAYASFFAVIGADGKLRSRTELAPLSVSDNHAKIALTPDGQPFVVYTERAPGMLPRTHIVRFARWAAR